MGDEFDGTVLDESKWMYCTNIGWAPCCIETGWTVAEILMGLQFMTIAEKICK